MNPYEVLGVSENADPETIKKAYRDLVKKYHPDKYVNNPLADLASEKLKEINKAYDMITSGQTSASYKTSTGRSQSRAGARNQNTGRTQHTNTNTSAPSFQNVRVLISQNRLNEAEQMLNSLDYNAEWYYLMGCIYIKRGWYDRGIEYLKTAVELDPTNTEYIAALSSVQRNNTQYRTTFGGGNSIDYCTCCNQLICADCCCECMGGDLIGCC